jgi:hypothetical protein
MPRLNFRDDSRKNYTTGDIVQDHLDRDGLRTGALLRIADATEKMALRHTELTEKADRFERWHNEARRTIEARDRSIAALRGQITKLKKRLAAPIDTHESP